MKASSRRSQVIAVLRHFRAGVMAGFNDMIRLDRPPFTAESLRYTWLSARSGFVEGFNDGMRLYLSPFTGFWHEASRLFKRQARRRID